MKRQAIAVILAGFIAASASGCKTTSPYSVNMYGNNMFFPARRPETVRVFQQKPPGDFIEMGEITVHDVWSLSRAMDLLRIKTAELGGDAIYIINTVVLNSYDPFGYSAGFSYGSGHHHDHRSYGYGMGYHDYNDQELTVTGVAIRYR